MNICKLFSKITGNKSCQLFDDILGYKDVKRLVRMALDSTHQSTYTSFRPACISQNYVFRILE